MQRVITSFIGAPLLVAVIYYGGSLSFFILAFMATGICVNELKGMFTSANKPFAPLSLALPFTFLMLLPFYLERSDLISLSIISFFIFLSFFFFLANHNLSSSLESISNSMFVVLYASLCVGHLILIRGLDNGVFFLFFVLATTWAGDTFAYYFGRLLGKHPLAPMLSPKKTIEGAIGGLVGSLTAGILLKFFFLPSISIEDCAIISITCGVFGQLGDLVESGIKRALKVKDSGKIIPGHGGLLDRVDGVLFSAPAFYYYYKMVIQ